MPSWSKPQCCVGRLQARLAKEQSGIAQSKGGHTCPWFIHATVPNGLSMLLSPIVYPDYCPCGLSYYTTAPNRVPVSQSREDGADIDPCSEDEKSRHRVTLG